LAAAALSSAGTATANCASISGISTGGSGGGSCTSAPGSFAIGIGPNTTANATGIFDGAVAYGLDNGGTDRTEADALGGVGNFALAAGKNTLAQAQGSFGNIAIAQGTGASAANPVIAAAGVTPGDSFNAAINIGGASATTVRNVAVAGGSGNIATNLGGSSTGRPSFVQAFGTGNTATNAGGNGNVVSAGTVNPFSVGVSNVVNVTPPVVIGGVPAGTVSNFGAAFSSVGQNNSVTAVGPLALAGTFGVNDHNGTATGFPAVTQIGFGSNIKTTLNP
jgi:hypothetical protein